MVRKYRQTPRRDFGTFHDGIMDQEPVIRFPQSLMRPITSLIGRGIFHPTISTGFFKYNLCRFLEIRCSYFRSGATWSGVGGSANGFCASSAPLGRSAPEWQCRDATVGRLWARLRTSGYKLSIVRSQTRRLTGLGRVAAWKPAQRPSPRLVV